MNKEVDVKMTKILILFNGGIHYEVDIGQSLRGLISHLDGSRPIGFILERYKDPKITEELKDWFFGEFYNMFDKNVFDTHYSLPLNNQLFIGN